MANEQIFGRDATTAARSPASAQSSIRRHLVIGIGTCVVLVSGAAMAGFATIAGAVIAPGRIVVESDVKKVQHPTGGVVGQLLVREGARVTAGQVLIQLDETQTRADLDMVLKALDELSARRARDEAERDGATSVTFPGDLLARAPRDPTVRHLIEGETRLFTARIAAREGQKAQLRERVTQLQDEIGGLEKQVAAKAREIALINDELRGVRDLFAQNLVQFAKLNALERTSAGLSGERGRLVASIARTKGKVAETELQILQVDGDMRTEVGKELAEIRGRWSELVEKRVAAEDRLKRIELRAPQDGFVQELKVHTIGGLVVPNEPAMLIVPSADQRVVEIQVNPQDIAYVKVGQVASLRFPSLNQSRTPEISGSVMRVAADVSQDQKTGAPYYTVRIRPAEGQEALLGKSVLLPGLPVEAHMHIGDRTIMSYLVKPLSEQIERRMGLLAQNPTESIPTAGETVRD
ncbi:HlyD family type I secretion periplasmic adaptor subunit [Methylobacterium durans]|uniref:Membrane fusion protein (MFP) family protein n=1 Tax=Methylobacterium durans TaxID=2202825 RepID=A0A2U8WC62_9HYPH|nr:HlyD family type I secretion periplasmic adaptor subunit [Methylobacterium durans]AWN43663.1 HlyD family type I secretion periplasmic adaptor subunit [Methylobacterium durans]